MTTIKVLVDTNILICAWDRGDSAKQKKAINTLEAFGPRIFLSVQNLSEFASVMMRHGCDIEWLRDVINRYTKTMTVLPLEHSDVLRAIEAVKKYNLSYWDAQVWSVARSNGVQTILTEDGPIGQTIEGVTYVNPLI